MTEPSTKSHWLSPFARSDGLTIRRSSGDGETWVVCMPDKPNIYHCPCCDKPLLTPRSAQMIADAVYPIVYPKPKTKE